MSQFHDFSVKRYRYNHMTAFLIIFVFFFFIHSLIAKSISQSIDTGLNLSQLRVNRRPDSLVRARVHSFFVSLCAFAVLIHFVQAYFLFLCFVYFEWIICIAILSRMHNLPLSVTLLLKKDIENVASPEGPTNDGPPVPKKCEKAFLARIWGNFDRK